MKKIYAVALYLFGSLLSSLSFCSWEPGSWKPGTSQQPSQTSLLASNIWYLRNSKNYSCITANKQYDVCVLFYENNEMAQVIDQVAAQFLDVLFLKVDINKFSIEFRRLPAICLYKKGEWVYFKIGSQTAQELTVLLKNYF